MVRTVCRCSIICLLVTAAPQVVGALKTTPNVASFTAGETDRVEVADSSHGTNAAELVQVVSQAADEALAPTTANGKADAGYSGLNPQLVWPLAGTVFFLLICIAGASYLSRVSRVSTAYAAMKTGEIRATSSSDITSSDTSSTNRELKSRMERFEKRLKQHKAELQARASMETSSESATMTGRSDGDASSLRPTPRGQDGHAQPYPKDAFPKQNWFSGSSRWKQMGGGGVQGGDSTTSSDDPRQT